MSQTEETNPGSGDVVARNGLPGLTGLDHIGITVPDIEEATSFLCEVIGCEYVSALGPFEDTDGDWMAENLNVHPRAIARSIRIFRCGPSRVLELFEYDAPDQRVQYPANSDVGGHHIALYVQDIDAAIRHLQDNGVEVFGGPAANSGPHVGQQWIYFQAPWGTHFELISHSASHGPQQPLAEDAWHG